MPRPIVILVTLLALVAAACGDDSATTDGELTATAVPAPTLVGVEVDAPDPAARGETVFIGVAATQPVDLRALPGLDQPSAGEVASGTPIEPLGQAFQTEDGLLWWQVRAGSLNGWIQPNVAYRGPSEDITDEIVAATSGDFESGEAVAQAVGELLAGESGGAEVIVVSTSTNAAGASVTLDLLVDGDDSVAGARIVVVSTPDAAGWQLDSATRSPLCLRGVAPSGLSA